MPSPKSHGVDMDTGINATARWFVIFHWHMYHSEHHKNISLPWTPVVFRSKVDEYLDAIRGYAARSVL